jgi:hypothetical protein
VGVPFFAAEGMLSVTRLVVIGIALIVLPFGVMVLEYLWALVTGATGEHLAAAGFWGVALAYFSVPLGVVLLVVGLLAWVLGRARH